MPMIPIPRDIHWPEHLGRITHSWIFESPLLIFKIEDASFGLDTQQSIVEILRYLHKKFDVRIICVEGSAGTFRDFSEVRRKLSAKKIEVAFSTRHLTGAEYLALTSDLPLFLYGVEDQEQYLNHTAALAQTYRGQTVTLSLLNKLKLQIDILKRAIFSDSLYEFDQTLEKYESGDWNLHGIVDLLSPLCL